MGCWANVPVFRMFVPARFRGQHIEQTTAVERSNAFAHSLRSSILPCQSECCQIILQKQGVNFKTMLVKKKHCSHAWGLGLFGHVMRTWPLGRIAERVRTRFSLWRLRGEVARVSSSPAVILVLWCFKQFLWQNVPHWTTNNFHGLNKFSMGPGEWPFRPYIAASNILCSATLMKIHNCSPSQKHYKPSPSLRYNLSCSTMWLMKYFSRIIQ